jgi:hypothetical protein
MKDSQILHSVSVALREFEEAVKLHEHHSLTESEVVRRQAVDRARQHVLDAALRVAGKETATR